jgi:tetratricopeptide (TPR) repeat protein
MTSDDAFALLQKKWTSTLQRSEADPLIEGLDYMPLALTQAAAFINRTPRMNIKTYLENVEYDEARLMDNNIVDIRRDAQASNSVMATWQTSFNYIYDRSLSAARLLSLMSLFDRQGIPKSLIEGEYTDNEHNTSSFEHDMYMLTSFCLVKASADGISLEMHGLVQYATKKWLHLNDKLEYWKKIYATFINKSFLVGKAEHWPVCRILFPHVQTALDHHCFKDADALEEWASIAHKAGWYMDHIGEFHRAHKLISDSLEVREILLPPDAPDILNTLNTLGVALSRVDRYDEAKTIFERAIKAQECIFGIEDTWTLTTMLNLASLYDKYGHWTEAEALLLQVLEAASRIDTNDGRLLKLNVLGVIASNKDNLGHYEESVALRLQVLQAFEKEFGPDHQETVTAKANLARTYDELGRYKEAEKIQLEIIEIHERDNQAEPEILCAKGYLASSLQQQGRWKEAETLRLEILEKTKAKLGLEHNQTLSAMGFLASTYWTQGRFQEAEALNLEVLARRKATFGEDHQFVFHTKGSLATLYASLERYAESEALSLEVLQYWKAKLGDRHPQTLLYKGNLAYVYHSQGRFEVAQQMEEDVLQARREIVGVEHPTTLGTLGNLAVTHRRRGLKEKAYELMEECYQGNIKVRDSEHPITTRYKEGLEKWRREDGLLTEKVGIR